MKLSTVSIISAFALFFILTGLGLFSKKVEPKKLESLKPQAPKLEKYIETPRKNLVIGKFAYCANPNLKDQHGFKYVSCTDGKVKDSEVLIIICKDGVLAINSFATIQDGKKINIACLKPE